MNLVQKRHVGARQHDVRGDRSNRQQRDGEAENPHRGGPESCGPSGCSLTTLASFSNIYLGQDVSNLVDTNSATLAGYHGTIGAFVRRFVQMYSGPKLLAQPSDLTPDATGFVVTKVA